MISIIAGVVPKKGDSVDPNFMFDSVHEVRFRTPSSKRISGRLADLCREYYHDFPWDPVCDILKEEGYVPLQEDHTLFGGMFCGADGRMVVELGDLETGCVVRDRGLCFTWHRMPSGKYEVVAYLS